MKWTILKRLTIGHLSIVALLVLLSAFMIFQIHVLKGLTWHIAFVDEKSIRTAQHLMGTLLSQVAFERKYLLSGDLDFLVQFNESEKSFLEELEELRKVMDRPETWRYYEDVKKAYTQYIFSFNLATAFRDGGEEVHESEEPWNKWVTEVNRSLEALVRESIACREGEMSHTSRIGSRALSVAALTAGCAAVIALLISFLNSRSINKPILRLQERTRAISSGQIEVITDIPSLPEIKRLAEDFNLMCVRLRELDDMKQDFISHVSHELRTPLAAIQSASGMLLQGVAATSKEKEQELLRIIQEESRRLIHKVNRILDLSRMEAGMMEYLFLDDDLFPLVQQAVLKLAPIAFRRGIELELKPPPDLPPVHMDEERIAQVLENLLGNALKFTTEGGKVTVEISPEGERNEVKVSVTDTGPGISPERIPLIFDKFRQGGVGRTSTEGTGLGLAIAKCVIADHGGKIWAESQLERGSTFSFTLPSG